MTTTAWITYRSMCGLLALLVGVAPGAAFGQSTAPPAGAAGDQHGFREFTERVRKYVKLQKAVESKLPAMTSTDLPEMITAHQQALARKLREARPHAKPGDLFTSAALDAFRRAAAGTLGGVGAGAATSRAYMHKGEADPLMRLEVNQIYPDGEPITAIPPELLAAFPPLPAEVAYRIVGRSLILIDVKSRLIVDIGRAVLPPSS
jgi:hypothetical protein